MPRIPPSVQPQQYPYPWLYPPPGAKSFDFKNQLPLPAIGATGTIISFQVRPKYNGIIRAYGNDFVGAGWTDGSGALIWQILHGNGQEPVQYYNAIVSSLGSTSQPFYHPYGVRVLENEIINFTVKNVSIVVSGGQLVRARLAGWFYPKTYDDPSLRR